MEWTLSKSNQKIVSNMKSNCYWITVADYAYFLRLDALRVNVC